MRKKSRARSVRGGRKSSPTSCFLTKQRRCEAAPFSIAENSDHHYLFVLPEHVPERVRDFAHGAVRVHRLDDRRHEISALARLLFYARDSGLIYALVALLPESA